MKIAISVGPRQSRHRWLKWIAWLMLLAGLGVGGLALASALGVWVGLWDFRRGFTLLGIANGHAAVIAVIGAALTIGLPVLSKLLGARGALGLAALALFGTVGAALAYYVPESFRPPEGANVPPIHDISTDTVNPPEYVAILPLRADAPNTVVYGGSANMTPERLAELTNDAYPDLKTRRLDDNPAAAFARALAAAELLGWEIVAQVPEQGRIEAIDTTFWFRFKDDIVIRIRADGQGSIIDARSLSRVGVGDVGTNARRLRAFFAAL